MKSTKTSLIIFAMIIMATLTVNATVRTVSNHLLGGAQYATFAAAYNASSSGDTVIIEGSNTEYEHGSISGLAKSLVIIGQGTNTQKQNFFTTKIGKISTGGGSGGTANIAGGSEGSKFYGIEFSGGSGSGGEISINTTNIYFENCLFSRNLYINSSAGNITFVNCVFNYTINLASISNIQFSNCIFNNNIAGAAATQTIYFDHCLFLNTGSCFSSSSNYSIKNSIFMNSTVAGISSSVFQNNIFKISQTVPPAGNTDAGNNTSGVDPLFVTYTSGSLYSTAHDYHLQAGSPAIGVATDATDIGLHGGFSNFSEQMEALIVPVVRSMNISNTTVLPNGTINVQVTSSKPDDN